jgi:quercetin dioxygenase-like cupin family protein
MVDTRSVISHAAVAAVAALSAAALTYTIASRGLPGPSAAFAQAAGNRSTEVMTQAMSDIAREMRISVTERDPGNASTPHRHPGHHTFGYVLEGTYEVKVGDGPVRQLKAGEAFYEPPGALHAISRNPSSDKIVKYMIIQVGDPTKPRTVQEK